MKADNFPLYRPVASGGAGGHMPPPHFFADQLTLSQTGGTDYAHLITTGTPGFLDLPTALLLCGKLVLEQCHEIVLVTLPI